MRKLFILLFIAALAVSFVADDVAQTKATITKAFQSGNAGLLTPLLADPVEITLPTADDSYSKAQASEILKKFFSQNKPKSYTEKHSGKSVDGSVFVIGSYLTTGGVKFRSYVLIKESGGKSKIQLIEFEEE